MDDYKEDVLKFIVEKYEKRGQIERILFEFTEIPLAIRLNDRIEEVLEYLKQEAYLAECTVERKRGYFFEVVLRNKGISYFEEKEKNKAKEFEIAKNKKLITISTGDKCTIGVGAGCTFNIDNSITNIKEKIEGCSIKEEKEELKKILDMTQEAIDEIKRTGKIPEKKNLFERVGISILKHKEICTEIINLIGQVVIKRMG